ncbi:T9SS type A sorting domain-containing protein [Bacteroidota bacterium]
MKLLINILLLFFLLQTFSFSQKQFNNWYCSNRAALTFNTPDGKPKVLYDNQMYEGSPASISDVFGNLLFYTNGVTVWNKDHEIMENGDDLFGDPLTIYDAHNNQTLIVPLPGSADIYYIFTTNAISGNDNGINNGLYYSIVDMSKNGGLGALTEKNITFTAPISGQVNGVLHQNGKDIWIITSNKYGSVYLSYLLTESGIVSFTTSRFPRTYPEDKYDFGFFGPLVKSLDGTKFASPFCVSISYFSRYDINNTPYFDIYNFDNSTGKLSNRQNFKDFYHSSVFGGINTNKPIEIYTIKLSPDGSKLYMMFSGAFDTYNRQQKKLLYQFDLNLDSASMINNCITLDIGSADNDELNMQIGPDKKLYYKSISGYGCYNVINNPNEKGLNCNLQKNAIPVSGMTPTLLPNDVFYFPFVSVQPKGDTVCYGEYLEIKGNIITAMPADDISWTGPNGYSSNDSNLIFPKATSDLSGYYKLTVVSNGDTATDSVYVIVYPENTDTIRIIPSDSAALCRYGSLNLGINKPRDDYKYFWSTGDSSAEIIIDKEGMYYVTVSDSNGCLQSDSVRIYIKDLQPEIEIIGNIPACDGDTIVLKTKEEYSVYNWSTGDSTREIKFTENIRCSVEVIDSMGCYGISEAVEVLFYSVPKTILRGSETVCIGGEETYCINKTQKDTVIWEVTGGSLLSGVGTDTIYVNWNNPGIGKIKVQQVSNRGCTGKDSMDIAVIDEVKPEIIPKKPVICGDVEITLRTAIDYESCEWSTSDTTPEITINSAGVYFVKVIVPGGCVGYDTVLVIKADEPVPVITGKTTFCPGDSTVLSVDADFSEYLWITGDTTRSIIVSEDGFYNVEVTDTNGCKGNATVEVKEIIIELSNLTDVNFGRISIDDSDEKTLVITNQSNGQITVNNIYLKNGTNELELLETPNPPAILDSGDVIAIRIDFNPDNMQGYGDSLIIEISEPCEEILGSSINGDGIGKILVWLPDITSHIDERICLTLSAKLENNKDIILNAKYNAEIRYDATAFYPDNSYTITGAEAVIRLDNRDISVGKDATVIGEVCGLVLLANENLTKLKISNFELSNPYCEVETIDGSLSIFGCQIDLSRVKLAEPLEVMLSPNPANDELILNIKSTDKGEHNIYIYNAQGIELGNVSWQGNSVNKKINIDVSSYPIGLYFVNVRSAMYLEVMKFLIVH